MTAVSKLLAAGVGLAALAGAAPAAAQYYPNYGYGYGNSGGLGAIIDALLGAQRYGQGYGGYGYNQQGERYLIEQCARQTEYRIQRTYGGYNAGYGSPYGGAYGGVSNYASPARIVAITRVDRRNGGIKIWGTATSGRYGGYAGGYGGAYGGYGGYGGYGAPYGGYGYNQAVVADLHFDCTVDYRGRVTDIDIDRNR